MEIKENKLFIVIMLVAIVGGWWWLSGGDFQFGAVELPDFPEPPTPEPKPEPSQKYSAVSLEFSVYDYIDNSAITSATTEVDICKVGEDGVIDFLTKEETITVNSSPEQSGLKYAQGDMLIFHVDSDTDQTGGTDYYDRWYYGRIDDGEALRKFDPSLIKIHQIDEDGKHTYKFKSGVKGAKVGTIYRSTTNQGGEYWSLGSMKVVPRVSSANLDTYATHGGTTLSSVTDGATWDTTAGASSVTFTSTEETFKLELDAGAKNVAYGCPMYTISADGEVEERRAVLIMTTTMTGIGADELESEDWYPIDDGTLYAEKGFYYVLPEIIPQNGDKFNKEFEIPIDASGAVTSTEYTFKMWVIDFQKVSSLRDSGTSTTTVPNKYGMLNEFGLDAMIHARAYSTSSGAGSGQALTWVITTD